MPRLHMITVPGLEVKWGILFRRTRGESPASSDVESSVASERA
jgi:hypothetical protein